MENEEEKVVDEVNENIVENEPNEVKTNAVDELESNVEETTGNETEKIEEVEEQQNSENVEEVVEAEVIEENAEPKKKFNGYAIASLVCSLIGLLIFGMPLGLAAIVTGINGIKEFDNETQKYKWIAVIGLVIGIIDVIFVSQYAINIYNQAMEQYYFYTQGL